MPYNAWNFHPITNMKINNSQDPVLFHKMNCNRHFWCVGSLLKLMPGVSVRRPTGKDPPETSADWVSKQSVTFNFPVGNIIRLLPPT